METRSILFDLDDTLVIEMASAEEAFLATCKRALQREKIRGAKLAQYFDAILISGEVGIGKPDTRLFMLALEALETSPAEAVMVGDSLARDILGAQHAGLKGIWLNRSGSDPTDQVTPDSRLRA
jgi:putative hydrolase of the HAD superfamily